MKTMLKKETAVKAAYAAIGAPMVTTRRIREYGAKVRDYSTKVATEAKDQFDEFATEGEKFADQMKDRKVVEELTSKVDLNFDLGHMQDRVEKVRDQLEAVLDNWRENFTPAKTDTVKAAVKAPAKKAPAKKAPAKKAPAKKAATRKPATKATATKAPAAKKAPAKKAPVKATK